MKFLDWKPIKWFIGLPMKTRIISAVVAGTVVVGTGVGVGVGVALNNDNNSSSDSSTSIEETLPFIESITVSGAEEVYIDEFAYGNYTITATYDDDSTETVALSSEYLSLEDQAKLLTVGSHTLTVNYEGVTSTLTVMLKNHTFEGVTFTDLTTTYDGTAKTLAVAGVPEGAEVVYDTETTYTNAGVYAVNAVVTMEYYTPLELSATLTINKATYDMSGVVFTDKTVTYNGESHSITATNLPDGVTAEYTGNSQINVGEYTITATFTGDSTNYEPIANMTATLTVLSTDLSGITFSSGSFVYDGTEKSIYITGELPEDVTVSYEENGKVSVGEYTVTAKFSTTSDNYKNLPDMTATLTITKATYDMSSVVFADKTVTYNGESHSIEAINLPNGVTVDYEENGKINAGTYEVIAKFTGDADNYNLIPNQTATLTIEKKELALTFNGETNLIYNGNVQKTVSVVATNLVGEDTVEITLTYDGEMIEAGTYTVTANLTEHLNYQLTENNTISVIITRATHNITFRQTGYADVVKTVADLATLTDIPTTQSEEGYTVEWNRTVFERITEDIIVETIKTPIPYTIDYVLNGGVNHANNPATYTIESNTISLGNPTKAFGSTFAGWFTTETFAPESKVTAIAKGSYGNVTFYAKWLDYRIENSDGFTIDYTQDTPIVFLKVPYTTENIDLVNRFTVSEGCSWALYADFVGWEPYPLKAMTLDVGINQAYIIVKHPNGENFTRYLLAIYRLDMLGYTFMNEDEVYVVDFAQEETELNAPETNPEKVGYHFDGWSVNGDIVTFPYTLLATTTFEAEYSPIVYTVNFNANNGTVTETERQYTIETGMTFELPTRDYYTFSGWYDSATDEGAYTGLEVGVFGDYSFYATWTPIEYAITYHLDGGENHEDNPETYNVEDEWTFATPTKAGYTFMGWYLDEELTQAKPTIAIGEHGKIDLYAKWEANLNTLHFDANSAPIGEMPSVQIRTDATYTLPDCSFTKAGYTFIGYATSVGGYADYQAGDIYTMGTESEYTLYAVWTPNLNTLHFNGNGATDGTMSAMNIYTDDTDTLTANAFAKDYYHFLGWSLTADGGVAYEDNADYTMGTESAYTLYAVWEADVYTITYELAGGINNAGNTTTEYTVESDTLSLLAPTRAYYDFVEWQIDGAAVTEITAGSHGDVTVTAVWNPIEYVLTYHLNGGTNGATPETYNVEDEFTFAEPTRTAYAFDGWFTDEGCTQTKAGIALGEHGEIALYAKWTPIEYFITYHLNGGTNGTNPETYNVEDEFTFAEPTRTHYTFNGWYTDEECTQAKTGIALGEHGEIDLYAKWTPIEYAITYHVGVGENDINNPATYTVEDEFNFINLSETGYIFDGWYIDEAFTQAKTGITLGEYGEINLYAKWTLITYAITYHLDGGENYVDNPATYTVLQLPITLSEPYKSAYYFDGWYCDAEYTIPFTAIDTIGGATVYAKFIASTEGLQYTLSDDQTSYSISGYTGTDPNVYLPDTYNGLPVTAIQREAFEDSSITSIRISDSVTSIGSYAFYNCYSLTEIQYNATECADFGSSNYIFYNAGQNGEGITVTIGANVKKIPAYMFCPYEYSSSYAPKIVSVIFEEGSICERIGSYAFEVCSSLTSVVIPDSVTSIGYNAFYGCSSLTNIYISDLASWCNISGLYNLMSNGSSDKLYLNNELITELVIPDSVTSIGYNAFYGCSSLTSVVIPDSVTSIGKYAFSWCSSLTSVKIGNSVTSIGSYAFYNCDSLTSITVSEQNTAYKSIDGNLYAKDGTTLIQYAIGKTATEFIIPDSVTSIGSYAFYGCSSLTSVVIPDSVTSIGYNAFYNCDGLTSVVIGDSVTSIGSLAFYDCDSLTSVVIGDSVTSIGEDAFYGCSSLTSVVIPDSVTSIGKYAFYGCGRLTSVDIGDSVTSIGEDAFYNCYKLVEVVNKSPSITITKGSSGNGYVGYYALAVYNSGDVFTTKLSNDNGYIVYTDGEEKILVGYTGSETDLILPSYITQINQYAFRNCSSLTSVEIPDGVTSIGSKAFYNCDGLTSVVIPDSVTSIGKYAFYDCDGLTSVVIPDSVTSIGEDAFYDCGRLTSVVIGDSVTSIGSSAFSYCDSLTSVVIGDSVTSIYNAFYGCSSLTNVYYKGTASDWSGISIGSYNTNLTSATRYYYSETEPATTGNYWHYDENGNIAVW